MGEGVEGASSAALVGFRAALYGCLDGWGDALFELADATLDGPASVGSVPALSLEPVFRRGHGSLYKALARGSIDAGRLRGLLTAARPAGWPAVYAVDASTWDRCDAETSPERGFYYSASRHSAGQPIVAGWSYQWIAGLSWAADSWTAPLDARRIPPRTDTVAATIDQVRELVGRLGDAGSVPLFVFDAGYDPIALGHGLADTRAGILVRIRSDRLFYADPVRSPAGTVGRPRRHGRRFACADPASWPAPDAALRAADPRYGRVEVQAWHGLHPRLAGRGRWTGALPPIVRGSVIRVAVEHLPKRDGRAKKTLWLWWSGPGTPDLGVCWRAYLRRFDLEHTFRFAKQAHGRELRGRRDGVRNRVLCATLGRRAEHRARRGPRRDRRADRLWPVRRRPVLKLGQLGPDEERSATQRDDPGAGSQGRPVKRYAWAVDVHGLPRPNAIRPAWTSAMHQKTVLLASPGAACRQSESGALA